VAARHSLRELIEHSWGLRGQGCPRLHELLLSRDAGQRRLRFLWAVLGTPTARLFSRCCYHLSRSPIRSGICAKSVRSAAPARSRPPDRIPREIGARKPLFAAASFWDPLMVVALRRAGMWTIRTANADCTAAAPFACALERLRDSAKLVNIRR